MKNFHIFLFEKWNQEEDPLTWLELMCWLKCSASMREAQMRSDFLHPGEHPNNLAGWMWIITLSTLGTGSILCKQLVTSWRKKSTGVFHVSKQPARTRLSHTQDQLSLTLQGTSWEPLSWISFQIWKKHGQNWAIPAQSSVCVNPNFPALQCSGEHSCFFPLCPRTHWVSKLGDRQATLILTSQHRVSCPALSLYKNANFQNCDYFLKDFWFTTTLSSFSSVALCQGYKISQQIIFDYFIEQRKRK